MKRPTSRQLAIGWVLLILTACTIPGDSLPSVTLWSFDKLIHFTLFAVLGWLCSHAWPGRVGWVGLAGLAYAGLTEVYQGLIPFGRTPDLYDALANTLGLLAGLAVYWLGTRGKRQEAAYTGSERKGAEEAG